jgi:uncharacterized protein YqgQ
MKISLKKLFQNNILIGGQLVQFATAQIAIGRNHFKNCKKTNKKTT